MQTGLPDLFAASFLRHVSFCPIISKALPIVAAIDTSTQLRAQIQECDT